ncbi:MAG: diacylglycerol kinase family lipid kinase [Armatimonadetes bacterium]|nr:diacylglycerol kinase family lipid kinase [Armatimonadota bacterium]MDW8028024.1 diacylglycerol kinase family lipid kinase [Armatimonadota bacterium]
MQDKQSVLLIVNPHAGGGKGKKWAPLLESALKRKGWEVWTVLTERQGDALFAAREIEADVVFVAGGDGVFHDTINGFWQSKRVAPVGLIPIGTGNVFAANMGIPYHPIEALEKLLLGQIKWLDVGEAHGRIFHSSLGIGFDAYVVAQMETVSKPQKRFLGKLVYFLQAIRHSLHYRWSSLKVYAELNDGSNQIWEKEAWLVLVSNLPDYGGVKVTPNAEPDDGFLDLCILPSRSKADYFRFAMLGLLGWHMRHPEVVVTQIRSAQIYSEPPVPTQMDGELTPPTPVTVRVIPKFLPVLLPSK